MSPHPRRVWHATMSPSVPHALAIQRAGPQRLVSVLALLALLLVSLPLLGTPGYAAGPGAGDADGRIPDRVLVRFEPQVPEHARRAAFGRVGAEEIGAIPQLDVMIGRVPEAAADRVLAALQRNPHVASAEYDVEVELEEVVPDDPWYAYQWGLRRVELPDAWSVTTGSREVSIAILDTGVSAVPDLVDKLLPGYNVLTGTTDVTDTHGHGTLSAGVAAASTDNGIGVASYCWDCMILPVKIMEGGSGTMSDLATGIVWAADNGADVISMSVSGASGTSTVANAVSYAADRGSLLVAAAGNNGDTTPRYPAAYSGVVGVAGTDSSDTLYSWSNHGSWVDVSAPGFNRSTTNSGGVSSYAGTSSATPAAAGVLGLGVSTGAAPAEVLTAVRSSSEPLSVVRYGRVDAAAMLATLGAVPVPDPEPDPEPKPDPEPEPDPVGPTASYAATCTELTCEFRDTSATGDADVVGWQWDFGDGGGSSAAEVTRTYAEAGSYTVTLTVTDANGQADSVTGTVTATAPVAPEPGPEPEPEPDPEPEPTPIQLEIATSKTRGLTSATLAWAGTTAPQVDVYVNGSLLRTVADIGSWTHDTGLRGNPEITYRVCEAGSVAACSDPVTVSSW